MKKVKKQAAKKQKVAKKGETSLTQLKSKDEDDVQETQTDAQDQTVEEEAPKPAPVADPKPAAKKKVVIPKKVLDPLDVVEPDPVFKNKAEKIAHDDKVRNEGLKLLMFKPKGAAAQLETDLEIEEPGAANSVAEEGAKTIQSESEYEELV